MRREIAETLGIRPEVLFAPPDSDAPALEHLGFRFARRLGRPGPHQFSLPFDLGEVRLLRYLAHGGMGTVYEGRMTRTNRRVAVKIVPRGSGDETPLRNEARLLSQVDHIGVVRVISTGETKDWVWVAIDYVEGRSLLDFIKERRAAASDEMETTRVGRGGAGARSAPTPTSRPSVVTIRDQLHRDVAWFASLARTLDILAKAGLTHRDVSPRNILIHEEGLPILIDFGLAFDDIDDVRGALSGTLPYMSPEHTNLAYAGMDVRSDLYSLAACFYELVTGHPVRSFDSATTQADKLIEIAHQRATPVSELGRDVPASLDPIFERALATNRSERYQSAAELALDLEAWLEGRPLANAPENFRAKVSRLRRRLQVAGIVAAIVAVTLGGWAWSRASADAKARARLARLADRIGHAETGVVATALADLDAESSSIRDLDDFPRVRRELAAHLERLRRRDELAAAWRTRGGSEPVAAVVGALRALDELRPHDAATTALVARLAAIRDDRQARLVAMRADLEDPARRVGVLEALADEGPLFVGLEGFPGFLDGAIGTAGTDYVERIVSRRAPKIAVESFSRADGIEPWALRARSLLKQKGSGDADLVFLVVFDRILHGEHATAVQECAAVEKLVESGLRLAEAAHLAATLRLLQVRDDLESKGMKIREIEVADRSGAGAEEEREARRARRADLLAATAGLEKERVELERVIAKRAAAIRRLSDGARGPAIESFSAYRLLAARDEDPARLRAASTPLDRFCEGGKLQRLARHMRGQLALQLGEWARAESDFEFLINSADDEPGTVALPAVLRAAARAFLAAARMRRGETTDIEWEKVREDLILAGRSDPSVLPRFPRDLRRLDPRLDREAIVRALDALFAARKESPAFVDGRAQIEGIFALVFEGVLEKDAFETVVALDPILEANGVYAPAGKDADPHARRLSLASGAAWSSLRLVLDDRVKDPEDGPRLLGRAVALVGSLTGPIDLQTAAVRDLARARLAASDADATAAELDEALALARRNAEASRFADELRAHRDAIYIRYGDGPEREKQEKRLVASYAKIYELARRVESDVVARRAAAMGDGN
ncbi:MAG: serine/threonine-protein kinase [Planctomycetota bacterium]